MSPQNLAPLSYASIIVGFTSFAFTFFTFVRVFWETILTLWLAPKELERVLDNLRLELHEEQAYLKSMIRRSKSRSRGRKLHAELGALRLLNHSVRDLMNDFKKLEEPFLSEPADEKEKDVERSEVSMVPRDPSCDPIGITMRHVEDSGVSFEDDRICAFIWNLC